MAHSLDGIWASLLQCLRKQISPQSYETWFAPTKQVGAGDGYITVETPNKFFKDWLLDHYKEPIGAAVKETGSDDLDIKFVVCERAVDNKPDTDKGNEKKGGFKLFSRSFERFSHPQDALFNQRYTFDSFVVGGCNRFSHAAALAVAESPAKAYNPLFIYGGVGLGKTHLMQAIGLHLIAKQPRLKVTYISSEKFTNQLISSIQNRTVQKFKDRYRHQDILLIDDIHFISGKEATQEEFFHTFNALYDAHKQIVVSSDKSPKEMPSMEKRLVSRFEWGLVTDMQPPDTETRIAILKKKLEKEAVAVPVDVVSYIADNVTTNIRELEGALIRVIAYSSLLGHKIDLSIAREVLKEVVADKKTDVNVERVQRVVAEYFGIGSNDMRVKKRTKKVAYPRQVAMFLSREMTRLSLVEIGGLFGGRDHSTVIHACGKIEEDIKKNPHIKSVVENIITKIESDD
jgi:chromosomal replication initiator protein